METIVQRLICLVIGYAFGLFQTGYIYGKLHGIDIRKEGSGNAGTTNALRVLGKKAGIITYIGDMVKAVLAAMVVRLIFGQSHADIIMVLVLYSGFGVILGHNFPFYLGFKGGKGIAASYGLYNGCGRQSRQPRPYLRTNLRRCSGRWLCLYYLRYSRTVLPAFRSCSAK